MKHFFVGRHGATRENNPKHEIMRGHSKVALDDKGRAEAKAMGEFLKDKGIKKIYYSPLNRAKQTAAIVKDILQVPAEADKRLETWNPGFLTGRPVDKVQRIVDYYESHPNSVVPDGESTGTFWKHVKEAWSDYKSRAQRGEGPFLLITSTRPIISFQAIEEGEGAGSMLEYWRHAPGPGSVTNVDVSGKKAKLKLVRGEKESSRQS